MSHTKGEWHLQDDHSIWSHQQEGDIITVSFVARVENVTKSSIEAKANAKLIAAAPELLEALMFCESVIRSHGMFDRSEHIAVEKAIKAIEKATI